MEDVISSIQASTSIQEEKVDSLEQVRVNSEQFIEDTYRIDSNVADLVNKRKDDFYDEYKYLKPDCEKNGWEKFKDGCKKVGEWCKEHWKAVVTAVLVVASIVIVIIAAVVTSFVMPALLVAIATNVISGAVIGGAIGGIISTITGGSFWKGFKEGAFFGAIGGGIFGGMGFAFTGAIKGVMTLGQTLLTGGVSGVGSILLGDLGDIGIKGEAMSLKEIVTDVIVAGVTGVAFAGIGYGLSKAFSALKVKMFNKGGAQKNGGPKYEFNMVDNPGPLVDVDANAAGTFRSGKYNVNVLDENTVLYRAGDSTHSPLGQYFTAESPASVADVRINSAVKPQWIDPKTGALTGTSNIDAVFGIEIPKGTVTYSGPAGYQGEIYIGGKEQIFISKPWNLDGVKVISSTPLK